MLTTINGAHETEVGRREWAMGDGRGRWAEGQPLDTPALSGQAEAAVSG